MPEILREGVPHVGSKVQKNSETMYLVFVPLDLEHVRIRRAKRTGRDGQH